MKYRPATAGIDSVSASRLILFLALDDVLRLSTHYDLADLLEIMRHHKRVTDRGPLRRRPVSWATVIPATC